jgi:hypothetical protein
VSKKLKYLVAGSLIAASFSLIACNQAGSNGSSSPSGIPVTQQVVPRIELMNDIPQPFVIIDYKKLLILGVASVRSQLNLL